MFGGWLHNATEPRDLQAFYFDRPPVAKAFTDAFDRKRHILLYGPPRQGKTTLLRRVLRDRASVTFHAADDTTFADIFRTYLLTLGASVTVEQKRKKSLGAKAEVSWKWPFKIGGGVDASAENEVTRRNFSADIANPNDVCYLLREFGEAPCLIVEHFEQIGRKQRRLLIEFLRISAETSVVQVILVATTLDFPLDYRERITLSRCLSVSEVPPLSRAECESFVRSGLAVLNGPPSPEIAALLYETFEGSVEPTLSGCVLAAAKPAGMDDGPRRREVLLADIHEQTQTQFLALIAAIKEVDWTITCARRVAHAASPPAAAPDEAVPIAVALAGDPVFGSLRDAIVAAQNQRPEMPREVTKLYDRAVALGKQLLITPTESEPIRLLAFALGLLSEDPTAEVRRQYEPAFEPGGEDINVAYVLSDMLLAGDPDQEQIVTPETLAAYFRNSGREIVPYDEESSDFTRLARRLRRLQRRLGIGPPVFRVADDNARITLWDPKNGVAYGDIKPRLRLLVDELRDDDSSC